MTAAQCASLIAPCGLPQALDVRTGFSSKDCRAQKVRRAAVTGDPVLVRVQPEMAKQLGDWRRKQDDLSRRPETIRRLVEFGLKVEEMTRKRDNHPSNKGYFIF